jgi:hypothetical protein
MELVCKGIQFYCRLTCIVVEVGYSTNDKMKSFCSSAVLPFQIQGTPLLARCIFYNFCLSYIFLFSLQYGDLKWNKWKESWETFPSWGSCPKFDLVQRYS